MGKDQDPIELKLDVIIRLLSRLVIKDQSNQDAILQLSAIGLDRSTIATLVGTTPMTVSVTVSQAKSGKKAKKKGRRQSKKSTPTK